MKRLAIGIGLLALLAGCVSAPVPTPPEPAPPPPPPPSPTAEPDLEQLRLDYGLPECPETDPDAEAVDGGLPHTELACLGTDQVVNLAGLPREPMVINLWAQWCGPCRAESPYLREVSASSDVAFIGINYDDPKPDWAIEFAGLVEWFYPHIQDMDRELQVPLKIAGIPSTLFVTADGVIAGVHPGEVTSEQELRDLMEQYLGQA